MSSDTAAAAVYARALLQATGPDAMQVADELDSLAQLATNSPAEWAALTDPKLTSQQRTDVVTKLFADGSKYTRNFLSVLVDRHRLGEAPVIARAFRELVKEQQNQLDVRVTTAVELPAELRARLEERLSASTGKQVQLHASVDPDIIGGLVVQHGDTLVDTSLRGRLENLRVALRKAPLRGK